MTLRLTAGAAVFALALALTGCGGGASEPKASSNGDKAAVTDCVAKAESLRDTKRDEVPLDLLDPVAMDQNKGKQIWVINAARVPFLQRISDGAQAAAKAAGMTAKVVYGDGTTNSAQAAVRQAIAQKADGIVLVVIDPTTIQNAVDAAKKAGIVVTDVINRSVGDALPSGLAGQMVLNLKSEMDAMAGWILADSKCTANTLMYSPSSLPITVSAAKALEKAYSELCPSCAFELKDLNYGNYASTLTPEVQTDVRRNPKMDYIVAIVGSSVPNVDAGLRDSNPDITVVAHDGLDDNLEAMRKGTTHMAADFAFAPSEAIGWQAVDQQGRLLRGSDAAAAEVIIPSRLVDKSNVGSKESDIWPGFADYEAVYKKLWGF